MLSAISSWFDKQETQDWSAITNWEKSDLINWFGTQYGYKTYLEVATATTGGQYGRIDRNTFSLTERLLYRTPTDFDDGMKIDHRCEAEDNRMALAHIRGAGRTYDVVFVDPYHTYAATMIDLENAIELLSSRGTLLVHDCNPTTKDLVRPDYIPGTNWCGLTYAAFLDFVYRRNDLEFCVVDTDWGVGIVRRKSDFQIPQDQTSSVEGTQFGRAVASRSEYLDWDYFDVNRQRLLHLVSVDEFIDSYEKPKGWLRHFVRSKKRQKVA